MIGLPEPDVRLRQFLLKWRFDLAAGLLLLGYGAWEVATMYRFPASASTLAVVVLAMAASVALTRHLPGIALLSAWIASLAQVAGGGPILQLQLAIVYVAFGLARWGGPVALVCSGLSIPAAVLGGTAYMYAIGIRALEELSGGLTFSDAADRTGVPWPVFAGAFAFFLLVVPWLVGLSLRLGTSASESRVSQVAAEEEAARAQRETEQAREIAALREEQAQLAADVHDVVGHSLAVILAQAESAQYLADDPVVLKQTMVTIATSARSSLQDIRQVLSGAQQAGTAPAGSFEELVQGVRSSGHEVLVNEIGASRPLPPELEVVAHRVVQEMLTNAIKHGRRDRPVFIERHWPEGSWAQDLRIEVSNVADQRVADTRPIGAGPTLRTDQDGQGLEGMRRRLEAVGGKLDVRQRVEQEGTIFTVTAWVPVSGR